MGSPHHLQSVSLFSLPHRPSRGRTSYLTLIRTPKKSPLLHMSTVPVGLSDAPLGRPRKSGLSQFLEEQSEASWPFLATCHLSSGNPIPCISYSTSYTHCLSLGIPIRASGEVLHCQLYALQPPTPGPIHQHCIRTCMLSLIAGQLASPVCFWEACVSFTRTLKKVYEPEWGSILSRWDEHHQTWTFPRDRCGWKLTLVSVFQMVLKWAVTGLGVSRVVRFLVKLQLS